MARTVKLLNGCEYEVTRLAYKGFPVFRKNGRYYYEDAVRRLNPVSKEAVTNDLDK